MRGIHGIVVRSKEETMATAGKLCASEPALQGRYVHEPPLQKLCASASNVGLNCFQFEELRAKDV